MASRTLPAIAMGTTSNIQGSQHFFCLQTKRILTCCQWTKLPIPDSIVQQFRYISMKERSQTTKKKKKSTPYEAPTKYHISHSSSITNTPVSTTEDASLAFTPTVPDDTDDGDPSSSDPPNVYHPDPVNQIPSTESLDVSSTSDINDNDTNNNNHDDNIVDNSGSTNTETALSNAKESSPNATKKQLIPHTHNTQSKSGFQSNQFNKVYGSKYMFPVALTQMSAKCGIKCFGQKAVDTLADEWKQLDTLSVFKGRKYSSLSITDRKGALRTVQLLKEKKDGRIKGRACVNGSRQRLYTAEEDASLSTVSTEALLITTAIDAADERYIATCDITSAFLKDNMNDFFNFTT